MDFNFVDLIKFMWFYNDLRQYLGSRHQKLSVKYDLHN
jgi:hypothetical protein